MLLPHSRYAPREEVHIRHACGVIVMHSFALQLKKYIGDIGLTDWTPSTTVPLFQRKANKTTALIIILPRTDRKLDIRAPPSRGVMSNRQRPGCTETYPQNLVGCSVNWEAIVHLACTAVLCRSGRLHEAS